jgi:hypothetical protein
MRQRRPFLVTLLTLGVLSFTVLQSARFYLGIKQWSFISSTLSAGMAAYIVLTGFVWAGVSALNISGLWRGRRWARRLTLITVATFSLYYWIDRLIVSHGTTDRTNLAFSLILNTLILLGIIWILRRRDSRAFFGDSHDRQS